MSRSIAMRPPFIRNEFQRYVNIALGSTLKDLLEKNEEEFKKALESFTAGFAAGFSLSSGMAQMQQNGGRDAEAVREAKDELKVEIECIKRMNRSVVFSEFDAEPLEVAQKIRAY
jgi:hypothetical protein